MRTSKLVTCVGACLLLAAVAAAGEKGTAAEAKALLNRAVAEVEKDGSAKALAAFNDPKGGYRDRDLYVFCMDQSFKITAHPDSSMLGQETASLKDENGKAFGAEMVQAAKNGSGTVDYMWKNPVSGKVEAKESFLKKAGDQYCGVGYYK